LYKFQLLKKRLTNESSRDCVENAEAPLASGAIESRNRTPTALFESGGYGLIYT